MELAAGNAPLLEASFADNPDGETEQAENKLSPFDPGKPSGKVSMFVGQLEGRQEVDIDWLCRH